MWPCEIWFSARSVWYYADGGVWWIRTGFNDSLEVASWWLQLKSKNKSQWAVVMMIHHYLNCLASSLLLDHEHRLHLKHRRICGLKGNMARFTLCFTHCQCSTPSLAISFSIKRGFSYLQMLNPSLHMGLVIVWRLVLAEGSTLTEDTHLVGPLPEWKQS